MNKTSQGLNSTGQHGPYSDMQRGLKKKVTCDIGFS